MNADASRIADTILALEKAVNERWNRGDVDGALDIYSDDVTYFDPMTPVRLDGHKAVSAYFKKYFEGKLNILRNNFPNPQVVVSDDGTMAVLAYNLINIVPDELHGEKTGTEWNSTQVYRLIKGQWRVVHVNWSFTRHPSAMQGMTS